MLERTKWDDAPPEARRNDGTVMYVIRLADGSYDQNFDDEGGKLSKAICSSNSDIGWFKRMIGEKRYLDGSSIVRLSSEGWPGEVIWTHNRTNLKVNPVNPVNPDIQRLEERVKQLESLVEDLDNRLSRCMGMIKSLAYEGNLLE